MATIPVATAMAYLAAGLSCHEHFFPSEACKLIAPQASQRVKA